MITSLPFYLFLSMEQDRSPTTHEESLIAGEVGMPDQFDWH